MAKAPLKTPWGTPLPPVFDPYLAYGADPDDFYYLLNEAPVPRTAADLRRDKGELARDKAHHKAAAAKRSVIIDWEQKKRAFNKKTLDYKLPFGQYKGKRLRTILKRDPTYVTKFLREIHPNMWGMAKARTGNILDLQPEALRKLLKRVSRRGGGGLGALLAAGILPALMGMSDA
jgi:hypothetical protein